ncbi:uncharacterized protein BDR25DRAFT_347511 [Lindgomyces ingoldianus]|uniref:Uncharacterized protein n=1 Tax=Lindgomyces ingoldianus TaxID=673940 RepID=A0ACB6Q7X6_9PLEO|nr:uncharacterized protein BDR25DRAFT_347511 [Lindgomyces ingoldianus]KAF2462945.1 hypothetical protein BDR25DRAFT_347511 [Lindgomyces ingoldianus]
MSLQQDTKPMFTGQLKRRVRTDEAWYHAELFLLSESHWTLSARNLQGFPITGQNSSTTQTTQTTSYWRRAKAILKWFTIHGLMVKRGLYVANGDPVPEQLLLASESAYAHNCTRNLFHRLPMELILEIASYLSPVARLVMQRVCRKFRAGLAPHRIAPELRSGFLTMKQIFQFVFLLRQDVQVRLQDDYERECDLAPPNSSLHRSGCSGCRTTHQMKYFSSEELSLSPKIRICKGLAAPFRLCRHLSFSGQCLLRALRVMKNTDYICQLEHENDVHNKFMAGLGGRQSGPHIGFHGGHTITIDETIPILTIGNDKETTHDQLSTALRKKYAYICPHLSTASPELFGGSLVTAECPDYTFSQIRDLERKHQAPECYQIYNIHNLLRLGKCTSAALVSRSADGNVSKRDVEHSQTRRKERPFNNLPYLVLRPPTTSSTSTGSTTSTTSTTSTMAPSDEQVYFTFQNVGVVLAFLVACFALALSWIERRDAAAARRDAATAAALGAAAPPVAAPLVDAEVRQFFSSMVEALDKIAVAAAAANLPSPPPLGPPPPPPSPPPPPPASLPSPPRRPAASRIPCLAPATPRPAPATSRSEDRPD